MNEDPYWESLHRLAVYNKTMNARLYDAAGRLDAREIALNRGAFFGSILGTFNHLLVADRLWLHRFAARNYRSATLEGVEAFPSPTALDETLYQDFDPLRRERGRTDTLILQWIGALVPEDLVGDLTYVDTAGRPTVKPFRHVVSHFFNHQTHHRGQVTALLTQAGLDVGVTDLLALVP